MLLDSFGRTYARGAEVRNGLLKLLGGKACDNAVRKTDIRGEVKRGVGQVNFAITDRLQPNRQRVPKVLAAVTKRGMAGSVSTRMWRTAGVGCERVTAGASPARGVRAAPTAARRRSSASSCC